MPPGGVAQPSDVLREYFLAVERVEERLRPVTASLAPPTDERA
jgi:hypothetical protein